ncbi:MAG: ribulose-phosphate 3-epimerase, partial [Alphaproteobacteria bacterium]|nr:ribulose-phosphate 3-epimerase [Alphaproteobacteria bacterium]
FDVHLMVQNPEQFLPMFENCGADLLTVHLESGNDIMSVLRKIKDNNIKAGLSLKPQTGAKTLVPYLDLLDNILVMTVNPGFGGQKFMEDQLEKISEISKIIKGRNITIEVDGGINLETAELCVKHGANVLVAGNFIFGAPNPMEMIKKLQNIGEK